MLMKIYKYPLKIGLTRLNVSTYFRPLSVAMQGDEVCLWAIVDPNIPHGYVKLFQVLGTGHDVDPKTHSHIGTVLAMNGLLVWHVFEVLEDHKSPDFGEAP